MLGKSTIGNFIVQCVLIVGASLIMIRTGQIIGIRFHSFDVPYAGELGFVVGAAIAFTVFAVLYRSYEAYQDNEVEA